MSGERIRRDFDTYLPRPPGRHRNDWWEADHTQLAVHVRLPDGRVVMPWATLFLDQATRALLGWAIAVTASQESVLAALRTAIDVDLPNGPMGGVPVAIRFDRGKEFLAAAVGLAAASLAIDAKPLPAYTPHLKGAVERVNSSIEQLFLATLPGFVHGARGRDGRLVEDGPLLGLEALVELFAASVVEYNTARDHQGLAGRTPLQTWNADSAPLVVVPPRHLRHLLLAQVDRRVTKRGVRLHGRVYNCAELCGWVGQRVEVRYYRITTTRSRSSAVISTWPPRCWSTNSRPKTSLDCCERKRNGWPQRSGWPRAHRGRGTDLADQVGDPALPEPQQVADLRSTALHRPPDHS